MRNLPKKEFKREIRRLRLDILVKENDYMDWNTFLSYKKLVWLNNYDFS